MAADKDTQVSGLLARAARHGADSAGTIIREYREASGQSQAVVAAAAGMSQQHLSRIEAGQRQASIGQRRRLAQILSVPPEELGLAARGARPASAPEDAEVSASRGIWRRQRAWLNQHRWELAKLAAGLYPAGHRLPRAPLIALPSWLPGAPVPLRSLELELDESAQATAVTGREPETAAVRPLRVNGERFDCYTAAVRHLDPPALFESRPSYRLLAASPRARSLRFGLAAYFDKLNVSEALGHELAAVCMDGGVPAAARQLRGKLPFRDLVGDPFDAGRRAVIPAITTLTVRLRRYPAPPGFLLHWRDPAKVATAGGVYDVVPAGEFQPSSVALWDRRNDFDLWRNMVREYSEELLGAPEHDGTRTEPVDYASWPLYQRLEQARADGTVTAWLLGVGLDALTLAATILTVVIIDDDVFEALFGGTVRFNDEGEIISTGGGRPAEGVPFTQDTVDRMLGSEPLASPGAACLALAWEHRKSLLA